MTASVVLDYMEYEDEICLKTVINPHSYNPVTGLGPGPQMSIWLEQCGCSYTYWTHFNWNADFPPFALEVEFSDHKVAMLFKLTWL